MLTVPSFVAGEELKSDDVFTDLDPSTGQPLAEVARGGASEVDAAVSAARAAFDSRVRRQSAEARSRLLLALAGLIRRDAARLTVNTDGAAGGIELPFGGWKRSGYGREKGFEGLLGYTQTETVVVGI